MKHIFGYLHHLFLPKDSNSFRAKLLHHDVLTLYLVVALTLTGFVAHYQKQNGSILGYATDISASKLFELTNKQRSNENIPLLRYNQDLAEAAQKKAEHMFQNDYWAHYGPNGETPWTFILSSGYQYEYAGENLAKNFLFSDGVVQAWMNSPTHKENLLRSDYKDVGFAIVNGILNGEETTLVVQMFGSPLYDEATVAESAPPAQRVEVGQQESGSNVLANNSSTFYSTYFNLNILFFVLLLVALFFDIYFASRLNIIRLKGKNLIHMLFLGFILYGAFIMIQGSIT